MLNYYDKDFFKKGDIVFRFLNGKFRKFIVEHNYFSNIFLLGPKNLHLHLIDSNGDSHFLIRNKTYDNIFYVKDINVKNVKSFLERKRDERLKQCFFESERIYIKNKYDKILEKYKTKEDIFLELL